VRLSALKCLGRLPILKVVELSNAVRKSACAAGEPELAKETAPRLWSEAWVVGASIIRPKRLAVAMSDERELPGIPGFMCAPTADPVNNSENGTE